MTMVKKGDDQRCDRCGSSQIYNGECDECGTPYNPDSMWRVTPRLKRIPKESHSGGVKKV